MIRRKTKKFKVGQWVHVNRDDPHWGRIAADGEICVILELCARVRKVLQQDVEDCKMALADTWDRGDDGFLAMLDSAKGGLADLGKVTRFIQSQQRKKA